MWLCGYVALWLNGYVAICLCANMAAWLCGYKFGYAAISLKELKIDNYELMNPTRPELGISFVVSKCSVQILKCTSKALWESEGKGVAC